MSEQAHLLDQSLEMLISQMMYLDFESLESLCRASPELVSICNDERLWRKKIEIEFPEFGLELPPGATYRETFRLLSRAEPTPIIMKDRADIFHLLYSTGDIAPEPTSIGEAVRSRSKQMLRYLIQLPNPSYKEGLIEAVRRRDLELVKIFLDNGVDPSELMIGHASLNRDLEMIRLITDRIRLDVPMRSLIRALVAGFASMSKEERREITEIANSLNARDQVTAFEQGSLAVLNNDPARLAEIYSTPYFHTGIAFPLVDYVYMEGDPALVKLLYEKGPELDLELLAGLPVDRLRQLASLGVRSDDFETEIYTQRPNVFFKLLDSGIIDPSMAVAYVSSLSPLEELTLISGLLDRRDRLEFDVPALLEEDPDLPFDGEIKPETLELFGVYV